MDPSMQKTEVNTRDGDQCDVVGALEYAIPQRRRRPVKSPLLQYQHGRRSLRVAAITSILLIASIWVHVLATIALSITTFAVSVWSAFVFARARRQDAEPSFAKEQRVPITQTKRALVVSVIIAVVSFGLLLAGFRTFAEIAPSITQRSNSDRQLRAIENGLFLYRNDKEPADTLVRLVESDLWAPDMLIARIDPNCADLSKAPPDYSSYVFFPPDPEFYELARPTGIILAFERDAWHRCDFRVLGNPYRGVFIQYAVEFLNDSEFARALETDRARRRELGWPVYEWNEKTGEVVQVE